jgi:DNA-3-methyladenine glycosylase
MKTGKFFPERFFLQPTVEVARQLLGVLLVRELPRGRLVGRIVETEAYCQGDAACHAVRSLPDGTCVARPTDRNRSMFGPPGHAYVYFTYGAHFALNVVAQKAGTGEAVLIRAMEPLEGIEMMAKLRGIEIDLRRTNSGESGGREADISSPHLRALTSGPGKLTQALAIDQALDSHDLRRPPLMLLHGRPVKRNRIGVSRRIGIVRAVEKPWRFFEIDNPFVSRKLGS